MEIQIASKSDLHRGLSFWDLAPSCSLWHFFVYLWNHKSNVKSEICRESKEKSFQDRAENKNSNFGCWSHFIPFIFWKRQTFTKITWKNSPHIKTENSPFGTSGSFGTPGSFDWNRWDWLYSPNNYKYLFCAWEAGMVY